MLDAKGYEVTNYGTDTEESVDYPDFAHPVLRWLKEKRIMELLFAEAATELQ
jgi:ribose 5-phosphate isomerase B